MGCGEAPQHSGSGVTSDNEVVGVVQEALGTIPSQPGCLSTTLVTPTTIYMSPTGDDSNPGTQALPVATLAGAQAKIPVNYTTDYRIYVTRRRVPSAVGRMDSGVEHSATSHRGLS